MSTKNRIAFKEIGTILTVFVSSILIACLFAWWGVRAFDAPRAYRAGDLFPSPQTAFHLAYAQNAGRGIRAKQYRFDQIVLYPVSKSVNKTAYAKFYTLIEDDKSIKEPLVFDATDAFQLVVYVKELEGQETSPFVEMQIAAKGDLYRILLRDQGVEKHWVYFSHPDISKQTVKVLVQNHE